MDRLALTRMIRFGIDDLSSRNGHHSFEEMCRYLVAERITSNVYPATGPVSGGGDQGRDFETFATNIQKELGPHGGFAALISEERIAFACTLQKKGVPSKIRRDLAKIAGTGQLVTRVYALVGSNVNAAKAAELKSEAEEKHAIALEILDGQALAELLGSHETFWIAARFLAIPSDLAPEPPREEADEPEWYINSRDRWRNAEQLPITLGELLDVRDGLRRAVFHEEARPDFAMWLSWMVQAAKSDGSDSLRQRARYETVVAQLRGTGDLRPADGHAQEFVEELMPADASWAELLDASVLLQYVAGAAMRARTSIEADWIMAQHAHLESCVESRLRDRELTLTQRTGLLDVLGHLRSHIDLTAVDLPDAPEEAIDVLEERRLGQPDVAPAALPLLDPDGAIESWTKFAELAPKAPLVPVDSLSEIVAFLSPLLVDRDGFRNLVELLDEVQAKFGGNAAAAERSRDRAMALLAAERPLDALVDLHEAKARWWHGDTLRGSLLALMLLSRTYEELGLLFAAKQHALIVVGVIHAHGNDEHGDLLAAGLMKAAELDYVSGAWCSATESYAVAMLAHRVHAEDPGNVERHQSLAGAYLHSGYIRAATQLISPALAERIKERQSECGIGDVLDQAEDELPTWTASEWRKTVLEQLGVVPFGDAGSERVIRWSALGISWEVRSFNTYDHCRAAERFAAAAQILCAELAQEDLVLLPTTIRVRIQAADPERTLSRDRIRSEPGNDGSSWLVDLIPFTSDETDVDPEEISRELTTAVATVLFEASMVSWDQYQEVLERCFERGLPHKIGAGRPYDDVAGVVPKDLFDETNREEIFVPGEWRDIPWPEATKELQGRTDPGPGYSEEKSREMIRNRYSRFREMLHETISRLGHDTELQAVCRELRKEGWKDWHLLMALGNARLNFRAEHASRSAAKMREHVEGIARHPDETADEPPLPGEWLTAERLSELRRLAFLSGIQYWDLELHQETPDLKAVERILGERYSYWTDDVDHEPLF